LVVVFVVTVGLLLNYWSGVFGDSGAFAELFVVVFVVTVGLLLNYWLWCLW